MNILLKLARFCCRVHPKLGNKKRFVCQNRGYTMGKYPKNHFNIRFKALRDASTSGEISYESDGAIHSKF